jgi:hypothetical protein
LHAELKLVSENPALSTRVPQEPSTALIKAHGEQFLRAALEEIRGLGIVRCITHRSLPGGRKISKQHFICAISSRKKIAAKMRGKASFARRTEVDAIVRFNVAEHYSVGGAIGIAQSCEPFVLFITLKKCSACW